MWKDVWFLSPTPYGLLLFLIQIVAAAAECENEFSWSKNGLSWTPHVLSTVSPAIHQKPTYGSLPLIHSFLYSYLRSSFFYPLPFCPSHPTYPHSAWAPTGPLHLGNMDAYCLELLATEGFSLGLADRWQLPEKMAVNFRPGSPCGFLHCWTALYICS